MKTFITIFVALCMSPALALGEVVVYNVDLGGTDFDTGHVLRVAGTISYDRSSDSLIDSALLFYHDADLPVLLDNFFYSLQPGAAWYWEASPTQLHHVVTNAELPEQTISWFGGLGPEFEFTFFSDNYVFLEYRDEPFGHNDFALLTEVDENFDYPVRFLVGTAAVPEPSSLVLGSCSLLFGFGLWMRRRLS